MADNTSQGSGSQSAIGQGSAKRSKLNSAIAQRQKLLLGGIGAIALIAGSMFIFGGEDAQDGGEGGATTIDTGGLVNRNLSQREFVATFGNRLDAQGRAIKDLQDSQLPKSAIEQELETLRGENARMLSDGQAAIDAISAENAALRSELETVRTNPPAAPVAPAEPRQGGPSPAPLDPTPLAEPKASLLSFEGQRAKASPALANCAMPTRVRARTRASAARRPATASAVLSARSTTPRNHSSSNSGFRAARPMTSPCRGS